MIKFEAEKVGIRGEEEMSVHAELNGAFPVLLDEMGGIVSAFILAMLKDEEVSAKLVRHADGPAVAYGVAERICKAILRMASERAVSEWAEKHDIPVDMEKVIEKYRQSLSGEPIKDGQPTGQYVN